MEESDYAELGPPEKSKRSQRDAKRRKRDREAAKQTKDEKSRSKGREKSEKSAAQLKKTDQGRGLPEVPDNPDYAVVSKKGQKKSRKTQESRGNGHALSISGDEVHPKRDKGSKKFSRKDGKDDGETGETEDARYATVSRKRESRSSETTQPKNNGQGKSLDLRDGGKNSKRKDESATVVKTSGNQGSPETIVDVDYATVAPKSGRKSRRNGKEMTEGSSKLPLIEGENRWKRENGSVKATGEENKPEQGDVQTDVTYATVPRKCDRVSCNKETPTEGSQPLVVNGDENERVTTESSSKGNKREAEGISDDVAYATVPRKGEKLTIDVEVDIHSVTQDKDDNTPNAINGFVDASQKSDANALSQDPSVITNTATSNGGLDRTRKRQGSTGEYSLPILEKEKTGGRRGGSLISRDRSKRDNGIQNTPSNRQQHPRAIRRSLSLQESRPAVPGNAVCETRTFSTSSNSSLRSHASSMSFPSDVGRDTARRNSLYDLIPEEPDKPLPNIPSLEITEFPYELDEVTTEASNTPNDHLYLEDGVAGGHVNQAFQAETNTSGTADFNIDVFKDEGYQEALLKRERAKARRRRIRILVFLTVFFIVLLVIVVAVIFIMMELNK